MVRQDTEPSDLSDTEPSKSDKSERVYGFTWEEWKEIFWIMFCPI